MASETKHTPTPWSVHQREDGECLTGEGHYLDGPDGNGVAYAQRSPADAAFICLAVNNHDALVEALERLLRFNEELCADVGVSKHYPSAEMARAVLARTSGERP